MFYQDSPPGDQSEGSPSPLALWSISPWVFSTKYHTKSCSRWCVGSTHRRHRGSAGESCWLVRSKQSLRRNSHPTSKKVGWAFMILSLVEASRDHAVGKNSEIKKPGLRVEQSHPSSLKLREAMGTLTRWVFLRMKWEEVRTALSK